MRKIGRSWFLIPKKIMKKYPWIIISVWLFFFVMLPIASAVPWDTPTTDTLYMRSDTHTVNNQLGYALNTSRTTTEASVSVTKAGTNDVYWAIRAWLRKRNNSTTELTDGSYSINVTRSTNGAGIQTVAFTPAATSIELAYEALVVRAYIKIAADSYIEKAIFITGHLETLEIRSSTWSINLFTNRTVSGGSTYGVFHWGDGDHLSRIEGFQVKTLKPWEKMLHDMTQFNWLNAVMVPWTYFIGDLIYAWALLFVGVTLYNRYNDVRPLIVMFWIFGGTGGFLTLLIPAVSLPLAWFLLAFALATTLYVLFK